MTKTNETKRVLTPAEIAQVAGGPNRAFFN